MGYSKNRVIIVCGSENHCLKARKKAFQIYNKIFNDNFSDQCITSIVGNYCNATCSFMVGADGGNNNGEVCSNSVKARGLFKNWLYKNNYDYVSIVFGGDDSDKFFDIWKKLYTHTKKNF